MTPDPSATLSLATWEEAWQIVKALQHTGPVTVQCGEGVPIEVTLPGPVTRIRLTRDGRRRKV